MNNYSQMPLSSLESQFRAWGHALVSHQSANLFFLKNTGMTTRLLQFADWYKKAYGKPTLILDLDSEISTDPLTFKSLLARTTSNIIVILRSHLVQSNPIALETILQNHYLTSPYSLLIVHECAPHELFSITQRASCLYVNQLLYQLPVRETDLALYIRNICKLWEVKLTNEHTPDILSYCGNQPWLINEYIRLQSSDPTITAKDVISSPSLTTRVQTLFDSLPKAYHEYWMGKNNSQITQELIQFGISQPDGQVYGQWHNSVLANYKESLLNISANHLIYKHLDLTPYFSSSELRVLALAPTLNAYSREHVAQTLYNDDTGNYSDWALSQAISRLRAKLKKLDIPISIMPKRGQGYVITRN